MIDSLNREFTSVWKTVYFDETNFFREKAFEINKVKKLINRIEEYIEVVESFENREDIYSLYGMVGNLYRVADETLAALNYFNRALDLAREEGNVSKELVTLIRLGETLKYNSEHKKALIIFEQAMDIVEKRDVIKYKDFVLQHQGKCYLELHDIMEAKRCFTEALNIRLMKNDLDLIASTQQVIDYLEQIEEKPK